MQAGAPYMLPDCQTYSGVQKRVLIKKTALKNILSAYFFEQISLPAALSVVERQILCRSITNTTNLTSHYMKKILAVAAFAFAFSVNGYAQEAAAPADSPAPAAQKCCKKDKKCPRKCAKEGKCPEKCGQPCSKGEKPCGCPKKEEAPKA